MPSRKVPGVSVILPVFKPNLEQLKEALTSVSQQTFEDFECLCIYDSPDAQTTEVLSVHAQVDPRIKVVEGKGEGLIGALNLGLQLARGTYVARMDADDISLPTRLERQWQFMQQGDYDIVGGHYYVIDAQGHYISARIVPTQDEEIAVTLASTVPFAHPSVMIRRAFLESTGLRYGDGGCKVAEDYQLWTQMYNRGARFGNVDEWILKYRWTAESLTRRVMKDNHRDRSAIRNAFVAAQRNRLTTMALALARCPAGNPEVEENLCFLAWKLAISHREPKLLWAIRKRARRSLATGTLRYLFE